MIKVSIFLLNVLNAIASSRVTTADEKIISVGRIYGDPQLPNLLCSYFTRGK